MISNFSILAMEATAAAEKASEAAHEGLGINLDLLETNVLNLALLLGFLVFYGRKALGNVLGERRAKIAEAIQEAEERQQQGAAALAAQQKKLAEAKAEAEKIIRTARERSQAVRSEIAAQSERDILRMREAAAKNLSSEQERVMAELKQKLVQMAIASAEGRLKSGLDESAQQQLVERSLAQLGGR